MKRIIYLLFIATTFTACFNDKGNYDYISLNEISVDTSGVETNFIVEQYDSLHIEPILLFSKKTITEEKLSYRWGMYTNSISSSESEMIELSTEKDLHMQVIQEAKAESYAIVYYITDTETNTVYQQRYTLHVQPSVVSGVMVLHSADDGCDIDYIATTNAVPDLARTKHMRNVIQSITGTKLPGNPVSVSPIRISWSTINYVYVATDEKFVQLSGKDFSYMCDETELFYQRPDVLMPHRILRDGQIAHTTVMINDRQVHNINNQSSQYWNYTFSDSLRHDTDMGDIAVAPYIYMPDNYWTPNIAVFYDTIGKRFVRLPYSFKESSNLEPFVDQVSAAFDVNNIGKDLIWFGIGYNAHGFALMTDYTLYRADFNMNQYILNPDGSTENNEKINDLAVRIYDMSKQPGIENAKFFDCGEFATLFMYATERDIYVTSIKSTTLRTTKINNDFPEDEVITGIMIFNPNYHQQSSLNAVRGNWLYVSTWNGTEGKIYEFAITRNTCEMNNTSGDDKKAPTNVFTGIGKIKDMAVKVQGSGDENR